jgi:hypothetical protein
MAQPATLHIMLALAVFCSAFCKTAVQSLIDSLSNSSLPKQRATLWLEQQGNKGNKEGVGR